MGTEGSVVRQSLIILTHEDSPGSLDDPAEKKVRQKTGKGTLSAIGHSSILLSGSAKTDWKTC